MTRLSSFRSTIARVPRTVQILGLVLLVGLGYVAVANVVSEPQAKAASSSAPMRPQGVHQIRPANSNLCLTASSTSAAHANGATIQQRACDPRKKTQKFEMVPAEHDGVSQTYWIRPTWQAGWCLDLKSAAANNVKIVQKKCNFGRTQAFLMNCTNRCIIGTRSMEKCLNIPGQSRRQNVAVALYDCRFHNQTNMQFIFV
jgi:hypothetical protein